jgi:hypothetical protein
MIESICQQRGAIARIRRMDDKALVAEAGRRHTGWLAYQTEAYRNLRTFLYRVCVNVLQERGLPVPE